MVQSGRYFLVCERYFYLLTNDAIQSRLVTATPYSLSFHCAHQFVGDQQTRNSGMLSCRLKGISDVMLLFFNMAAYMTVERKSSALVVMRMQERVLRFLQLRMSIIQL